jgi:hypothetical protein
MKTTMKTRINYSAVIALTLTMASCATPYQSTGFVGGYSDTALAPDVYRVSFQGNGYTSLGRAQDFAMLRAADTALSHGFRYFAIVDKENRTTNLEMFKPNSDLLIRCFAERPGRGYVFDARFLSNSIRTKYHMTATS